MCKNIRPGGTAGENTLVPAIDWDRSFFISINRNYPTKNIKSVKGAEMRLKMSEEKKIPYKIYLEEHEMPMSWYNVRADMKTKPAPL